MDMMAIRRRVLMASKKKRLPSEYQEVEYIESTGTQWIDTGLVGNISREWTVEFSDFDRNGITYAGPFGITWNNAKTAFSCSNTTSVYCSFGNKTDVVYHESVESYRAWATSDIKKISISKNGVYRNDVQRISAFTGLTYAESVITMPLFARKPNANTVDRLVKMKLYSFVCKEEGINVGDFVPCYRKSDGEIGLYDTVSKTFFTNQGTGTFLKGAST